MRTIAIVLGVLVLLVAGALFWLGSNLDALVAQLVEKYGTQATGTAVNVAGVELSLGDGRGTIRGLHVANPEGFSGRPALSLDELTLDIAVDSVGASLVVIDEIRVARPVVRLEVDGTGRANLDELRGNLERNTTSEPEAAPEEPPPGAPPRIRVRRFVFEEGSLEADTTSVGGEERQISLPSLELRDVGGEAGATPGTLARTVMGALVEQAVAEAAARELEGLARTKLEEELEERGVGGEAGRLVEEGADRVKGLLGR